MIRRLIQTVLAWRASRLARKLERERMERARRAQRERLDILFPRNERRPRRCGQDHRDV